MMNAKATELSPSAHRKPPKAHFWLMSGLVMGAALLRVVPHPPNFTPVAAMALFGGAHFDRKAWSFAVPLAAMLLSDIVLEFLFGWGFHATTPVIYGTFAAIAGFGLWLRERPSNRAAAREATVLNDWRRAAKVSGAALAASTFFFLTTNFGVWAIGGMYPNTVAGLLACYTAALPFFGPTLAGDLFYTFVLFAAPALAAARFARFRAV
jgi:hypothetical protein